VVPRFVYTGLPARVVFGAGALDQLPAEVARLGARQALVLSTPGQHRLAEEVARRLGPAAAGIFAQAVMHVPIETAEAGRAAAAAIGADCCVAIGGGSTIGLAKAIATGPAQPAQGAIPILAIPTTFSGSEMTPIHGFTAAGRKTTMRDLRALPRTVIYDPLLLTGLPVRTAGPSGMNAIAHCVEALYAEDANPITSLLAEEGIRALAASLPRIQVAAADAGSSAMAEDLDARAGALWGACLAGTCLGSVGMALHHKLCHTLGGSYNLPHAETHTVVLPHAVAYNRAAAPEAMARLARALGVADPAQGLQDLARALGAPTSLRALGMKGEDLDQAARLALQNPYYNPRPLELDAIRQLLADAWDGRPPRRD